jgi:hypothetical protein
MRPALGTHRGRKCADERQHETDPVEVERPHVGGTEGENSDGFCFVF